jgi:hypothetical protein
VGERIQRWDMLGTMLSLQSLDDLVDSAAIPADVRLIQGWNG